MSNLYASRWADTPPAEETPQKPAQSLLYTPKGAELSPPSEPDQKRIDAGTYKSRWADTPSPPVVFNTTEDEGWERVVNKEELRNKVDILQSKEDSATKEEDAQSGVTGLGDQARQVQEINNEVYPERAQDGSSLEVKINEAQRIHNVTTKEMNTEISSPSRARLNAPRLKKKVSWRGKNLIVSIPDLDYDELGLVKPWSLDDFQKRLKGFEDAGYNIAGFDMLSSEGTNEPVHAKPIYPEDNETLTGVNIRNVQVMLPDLDKWAAYMDELTEKKLAALGVSTGAEDQPAAPSQDVSRRSSTQYPPLPFSPPIPSNSAVSFGRPAMVRGHSHAMSVASPVSPLNGPFGHAHRHSVFTSAFGFQQIQSQHPAFNGNPSFSPQEQQSMQQSIISGVRSLSPQHQFMIPGFNRGSSPVQLAVPRMDPAATRSTSSPLSRQMPTQTYDSDIDENAMSRQDGYFHNVQQSSMSVSFTPQAPSTQPVHSLPQLPEEDDEDELLERNEMEPEQAQKPERAAYVPPHKRAELNANIAVPTPRGHRHNISEGLERDIMEAEKLQGARERDFIVVEEEGSGSGSDPGPTALQPQPKVTPEKDPLSQGYAVQEVVHSHKKSASRLNVAAPAFKFNPGASFQPGSTAFTFGVNSTTQVDKKPAFAHSRQQSSGAFNVTAPEFRPTGMPTLPKPDFNFSTSGPSFKPNALSPSVPTHLGPAAPATGSSIFGSIKLPDFVKPTRKSKAVTIRKPSETFSKSAESDPDSEPLDEEGRIAQSEDRLKRQRKAGDNGDEVPRFAEPTPLPAPAAHFVLKSQLKDHEDPRFSVDDDQAQAGAVDSAEDSVDAGSASADDAFDHEFDLAHGEAARGAASHKHHTSSSLSALARPFEPNMWGSQPKAAPANALNDAGNDLEEGEVEEDDKHAFTSPLSQRHSSELGEILKDLSIGVLDHHGPASPDAEPSFAEIDAVMRQLNEVDADEEVQETADISPLPSSGYHPMHGVADLPSWPRSDAPSPSPRRRVLPSDPPLDDSSFAIHERTDSGDRTLSGWPQVNRLNKGTEIPTSDWSADFSVQDDEKLHQRTNFLDSHIDNLIGRVLERRLQPLEESLQAIQISIDRRPTSRDLVLKHSSSMVDSDADDEDDLSGEQRQRPISRGKDKRTDHIKAAVLEALRESSPSRRSKAAFDVQELHTHLADIKASFARAPPVNFELEDIRSVVEDAVNRRSEALVPIALDGPERKPTHQPTVPELEERLNQTLASKLEETHLRRAAETREDESKRALQFAEDELRSLRDLTRDYDTQMDGLGREREHLLQRAEAAEEARSDLVHQVKNLEKENAATYATLEEYRTSSTAWRSHIDQATSAREELGKQLEDLRAQLTRSEAWAASLKQDLEVTTGQRHAQEDTVTDLKRQLEDSHESSNGMKRRLEKLHADMATAAGQLVSEKSVWSSKMDELQKQNKTLEVHAVAMSQSQAQLEKELSEVRAGSQAGEEAQLALEQMAISNSSLSEMVRNLQIELADKESLATRYERNFNDARESGRAEVQRIRMALETDVETANHQVNFVRTELESELSRVKIELENHKMEAKTVKARHDRILEDEGDAMRQALRKVNQDSSAALHDARQKHEASLHELRAAHERNLGHAIEDKQRSEFFLNERLALSEAKLQHFQDRVLHLEERLEVTKSAAQAAALSAQSRALPVASAAASALPDKVSPQALRESILVLQEQLQERESQIDQLQNQLDHDAPAKLKARDDEIAWLRELLAVRNEDLTDLVNTLSQPTFDRNAIRDNAIRIRANLQMEQQEKERSNQSQSFIPGQAIASLSSFATPKAAQLTSAFNKWRSNMESTALKTVSQSSSGRTRSYTPSKASHSTSVIPPAYMSGLMTPPASNLRSSPSPEAATSLPPPRLQSRPSSKASNVAAMSTNARPPATSRQPSASSEAATTALFRSQSYDEDAPDNKVHMQSFDETFEDDDLEGTADNQPPAFRNLEAELEDADEDEAL